jgi:hypothetical protein
MYIACATDMLNFYSVPIQWNHHQEEVDPQPIPVQVRYPINDFIKALTVYFYLQLYYNLYLYLWPRCVWSFGHILHVQIVCIVLYRSVKKKSHIVVNPRRHLVA